MGTIVAIRAAGLAAPEGEVLRGGRGGWAGENADHPADAFLEPGLQDVGSPRGVHGGLVRHALLHALKHGQGPFVWVQDGLSRREAGTISARGLAAGAIDPARLIRVRTRNARDALWAMEEAVKGGVNVVGEVDGTARVLDFTATRRLELFARANAALCILVRMGGVGGAASPSASGGMSRVQSSGARWRWRVVPHPSAPDPHDPRAPGAPRWMLELVRARSRAPGRWIVEAAQDEGRGEGAAHRLRVVPALAAGDVAARAGAAGPSGEVVRLGPGRAA